MQFIVPSASERGSAMIIFNTFDRLQNKSGNIIEHLYSHLEKILAKVHYNIIK